MTYLGMRGVTLGTTDGWLVAGKAGDVPCNGGSTGAVAVGVPLGALSVVGV